MNTDDIMRMAQKAGAFVLGDFIEAGEMDIEQFANLVAAASASVEREACAKVCENWTRTPETTGMELTLAAAAIRARGQE